MTGLALSAACAIRRGSAPDASIPPAACRTVRRLNPAVVLAAMIGNQYTTRPRSAAESMLFSDCQGQLHIATELGLTPVASSTIITSSYVAGMVKKNVAPLPGWDSTQILPP